MINAQKELVGLFNTIKLGYPDISIKCGWIQRDLYYNEYAKKIILPVDYTSADYTTFLDQINFEYDNGYGYQVLEGIIWFDDGAWLERKEYDGSEWWEFKRTPSIEDFVQSYS